MGATMSVSENASTNNELDDQEADEGQGTSVMATVLTAMGSAVVYIIKKLRRIIITLHCAVLVVAICSQYAAAAFKRFVMRDQHVLDWPFDFGDGGCRLPGILQVGQPGCNAAPAARHGTPMAALGP